MPSRRRNKARDRDGDIARLTPLTRNSNTDSGGGKNAPVAAAASSSSSSSRQRTVPERPLCRFFVLHGNCRYGKGCAYSHQLPEGGIVEARAQMPCPYFARGCCKYGEHCQLRHDEGDLGLAGKKFQATGGHGDGKTGEGGNDEDASALTCGICLEKVTSTGRKFGLLSCPHVFCFECLMEWRKEGSSEAEDRRACPTCRKHSDYIVPSEKFCVGDEKDQVVIEYKSRLAFIPCQNFDGTLGSCRFGRDCFYAHLGEDGEDTKPRDKTMRELHEARMRRRQRHDSDELDVINNFLLLLDLYASSGAFSGDLRVRRSDLFSELWEDESDSDDEYARIVNVD